MTQKYELTVERRLDATPEGLTRAWTDPELIKQWWCPRPYETTECEIDLRPGGRFFTRMRGPDFDFAGESCILEVVPGRRIVWTSALLGGFVPRDFAGDGSEGFPFTAIHEFEDDGVGGTHYKATVRHRSEADRDAHAAMGFAGGWATCAEQMAEVARTIA